MIDDKIPDTERPPTAWKIRVHVKVGERFESHVCYTSLTTRAEATAVAEMLMNVYCDRVMKEGLHPRATAGADEWNPDQPDADSDGAVSLESAILWALGR